MLDTRKGKRSLQSSLPTSPALANLHGPERFRAMLDRERARVDRRGGEFCVLTFKVSPKMQGGNVLQQLVDILPQRLRVTDDIGWMEDGRLAALLVDTPVAGAEKVAEDLRQSCDQDSLWPGCVIYRYPDAQDESSPKDSLHSGSKPAADRARGPHVAASLPTVDAMIQPLELLFMLPMPWWKRLFDIAGASFGLLLFSPLLAIVALIIRRSSPGPIFYRQLRSGCGGRPFAMVKFRSMVTNADAIKAELMQHNEQDGPAFKIQADPRVTKIGRFIRRTSIDELPQLWNVFKGEMSLVGPRPLPIEETAGCEGWQRRRLDVTPGLTCIWQVRGRSRVTFDEWIRMDLKYIEARTLWSDLKLILLTVPAVLLRRGAS